MLNYFHIASNAGVILLVCGLFVVCLLVYCCFLLIMALFLDFSCVDLVDAKFYCL